ncbi:Formyl_trans_N domain-containing protein [Cephalotus follicularis]|uniref:Phosphoribosylglycinamide formyltransferase, chloroplastic n=1 Tax=Cephalotus follicularis TaxID=3775 RepID=A0A1Q3BIF0_CEPFO|nr:Formyl_trans_N domain-containing protein [Cephalotus follicularis]
MNVISIEAQNLISGFYSVTKIPATQNTKNSFFTTSSFVQCHGWVPFKTHNCFASLSLKSIKQKIEPKTSVEKSGDTVSDKEGIKTTKKKKLAVFVSGGGSNFKAIHETCVAGSVHGEVVVLVTNKRGCGGAEYARNMGIPVILFPRAKDELDGLSSSDLVAALRRFEVHYILLAGYLKLLPVELIRAYPKSIVNIHPSLLPAFGGKGYYGMKVHKAVIASGARYSGATIHFVDEKYDTGKILAQRIVPVLPNDSAEDLAARVLQEEHKLYVEVTAALCEERIVWREDGVPLIQSKQNPTV